MLIEIPKIEVYTSSWLELQRWMRLAPLPKITPREAAIIAITPMTYSEKEGGEVKMFKLERGIPEVVVLDEKNSYWIDCGYLDMGMHTEVDNQTGEIINHRIVGRV